MHINIYHPKEIVFYPRYSKFIEKKGYTGFYISVDLKKGAIFSIEGGNFISKNINPELDGELLPMVFNEKTYLYQSDIDNMPPSWYANHSCDPNIDMLGRIVYIINRDIKVDAELTDVSTFIGFWNYQ